MQQKQQNQYDTRNWNNQYNTSNWNNQNNQYDPSKWNSQNYYNTWWQQQQMASQSLPHLYGNTNNENNKNTYSKPYYDRYKQYGGSSKDIHSNKAIKTFNAQNNDNTEQWPPPPPPPPPLQTADILNMNKPLNITAITTTVNARYFNSDSEEDIQSKSADESMAISSGNKKKKKKKVKRARTPKILDSNNDLWEDYTEQKKAEKKKKKDERKRKKEEKKKRNTPKYDTKKFVKHNYKDEDTSSDEDQNVDQILEILRRKKAEKSGKVKGNKTKKHSKKKRKGRHEIQKTV